MDQSIFLISRLLRFNELVSSLYPFDACHKIDVGAEYEEYAVDEQLVDASNRPKVALKLSDFPHDFILDLVVSVDDSGDSLGVQVGVILRDSYIICIHETYL